MNRRLSGIVAAASMSGALLASAAVPETHTPDATHHAELSPRDHLTRRTLGNFTLLQVPSELAVTSSLKSEGTPYEEVPLTAIEKQQRVQILQYTDKHLLPAIRKQGIKQYHPPNITKEEPVNLVGQITIASDNPDCVVQLGVRTSQKRKSKPTRVLEIDTFGPKYAYDGRNYSAAVYSGPIQHPDRQIEFPSDRPDIAARFAQQAAAKYCAEK